MLPRNIPLLLCSALSLGASWAADSGSDLHARGPFDAASGVYTVVGGDNLGSIAARFGTSISRVQQQNNLSATQLKVGQTLLVAGPGRGTSAGTPADPADPAPLSAGGAAAAPTPLVAPDTAPQPPAPTATTPTTMRRPPPLPTDPWPRKIQVDERTLLIYQPQVVSWAGNLLVLRAAVAVTPQGPGDEAFGVIEAQARTQVDRVRRLAVLQGLKVTKADFPTVPALAGSLASAVAEQFGAQVRSIPLERLAALLNATPMEPRALVAVQNPIPRIIVNVEPAILIPVQGAAVLRAVADTKLQRVINTRAVILTESADGPYYLHLLDGWVSAQTLAGPWTRAPVTPAGMDEVASQLAAKGEADLLNGRPNIPTMQLLAAGIPKVYVTDTPSELIVFKGQPKLVPITGTKLQWAANTSADVIQDTDDGSYYVLLTGRWYRAASLQGPWTFVASSALPSDFKAIPAKAPAGVVLATVAGTPQAQAALIANRIPQTAAVRRQGGPTFKPVFDGPATVSLLPGTDLEYVVNCETPIVRVGGESYFALQAGVWFDSATLNGPWAVADSVPAAIYGIPPSSPLHYVTYARVYGSTPEVVYDGYTPGYLGTVASTDGVVVYGTGYDYHPWIGDAWYAAPETFGLAAQPVYNPRLGYGYGFGQGLSTAAAADTYWGGADYRPGLDGLGCCVATGANVYDTWGDHVAASTRAWDAAADSAVRTGTGIGADAGLRTGTTDAYVGGGEFNPATGVARGEYGRTVETAGGGAASMVSGARYDPASGIGAAGTRVSVSGPGGDSVTRDTATIQGPAGNTATVRQTTFDNERTGEDYTLDRARVSDNLYAGADGSVYRDTGNGWQQRSDVGWQDSGANTGWADQERQARALSEDRMTGLQGTGWDGGRLGDAPLMGNDGFGGGGVGGDGLGDARMGGGDPFSSGVGARFGGGGFGGRFGGRR